jgi:hypothetical protein
MRVWVWPAGESQQEGPIQVQQVHPRTQQQSEIMSQPDAGIKLATSASDLATKVCGLSELAQALRVKHPGCALVNALSDGIQDLLSALPQHATDVQAVIQENRNGRTQCRPN